MRYIIISDSHGCVRDVQDVIDLTARSGPVDGLLHLGDGAADALAAEPYLHALFPKARLEAVRGNCDLTLDLPYTRVLDAGGVRLFLTHGHAYRVKYDLYELACAAREQRAQAALYGHTHASDCRVSGGVTLLNPGALCNRRKGRVACAVLLIGEQGAYRVEWLNWAD